MQINFLSFPLLYQLNKGLKKKVNYPKYTALNMRSRGKNYLKKKSYQNGQPFKAWTLEPQCLRFRSILYLTN